MEVKTINKVLIITVVLMFIAAGFVGRHAQSTINEHRWIVLREPIRFEHGFSVFHSFTVDVPATYQIEVECLKTIPFDTIDRPLNEKLSAEFTINSGANRVASGNTSRLVETTYSGYSISRNIAAFGAITGVPYSIDFHVTSDLPQLAPTLPVLKISIDPHVYKEAYVRASLFTYLAMGLVIVGLVCAFGILRNLVLLRRNAVPKQSLR